MYNNGNDYNNDNDYDNSSNSDNNTIVGDNSLVVALVVSAHVLIRAKSFEGKFNYTD